MLKAMISFCVPYTVENIGHWPPYTGVVKTINTMTPLVVAEEISASTKEIPLG